MYVFYNSIDDYPCVSCGDTGQFLDDVFNTVGKNSSAVFAARLFHTIACDRSSKVITIFRVIQEIFKLDMEV